VIFIFVENYQIELLLKIIKLNFFIQNIYDLSISLAYNGIPVDPRSTPVCIKPNIRDYRKITSEFLGK
jgi:hypothetical protein